jgi:uroporphyrinogen-III synthase
VIRIALTRAAGGNDELAGRLAAAGLEPVECPLIAIEPRPGPPLDLEPYSWLVLTSRHAVAALEMRGWTGEARLAAIGPGTAAAARAHGLEPDLVPDVATQEGLLAAFPPDPGRVLFAGAEDARDVLARGLDADVVPLYRTVALRPDAFPAADLVVLASASAARAFAALGVPAPVVSIGPVTSAAAREAGLTVAAEAETHDLDGLERAVRVAASSIASSPS